MTKKAFTSTRGPVADDDAVSERARARASAPASAAGGQEATDGAPGSGPLCPLQRQACAAAVEGGRRARAHGGTRAAVFTCCPFPPGALGRSGAACAPPPRLWLTLAANPQPTPLSPCAGLWRRLPCAHPPLQHALPELHRHVQVRVHPVCHASRHLPVLHRAWPLPAAPPAAPLPAAPPPPRPQHSHPATHTKLGSSCGSTRPRACPQPS